MVRAFVFLTLLAIAGFTGCQTCDDCTDYSSPVTSTDPAEGYSPSAEVPLQ